MRNLQDARIAVHNDILEAQEVIENYDEEIEKVNRHLHELGEAEKARIGIIERKKFEEEEKIRIAKEVQQESLDELQRLSYLCEMQVHPEEKAILTSTHCEFMTNPAQVDNKGRRLDESVVDIPYVVQKTDVVDNRKLSEKQTHALIERLQAWNLHDKRCKCENCKEHKFAILSHVATTTSLKKSKSITSSKKSKSRTRSKRGSTHGHGNNFLLSLPTLNKVHSGHPSRPTSSSSRGSEGSTNSSSQSCSSTRNSDCGFMALPSTLSSSKKTSSAKPVFK